MRFLYSCAERKRLSDLMSGYRSPALPKAKAKAEPMAWTSLGHRKKAQAFEKDYTALLLALASSVRTGMDPMVALSRSAELFPEQSVIHLELKKFAAQINSGSSEQESILNFASSIKHPDLPLFRTALSLAREEGSSLGDCLQRLARVTRARQSFRRKIKSAIAMQKLSAIGIAGCTLVISAIQISTNPEAIKLALAHPVGSKMIFLGVSLVVAGLIWMLRMARVRI